MMLMKSIQTVFQQPYGNLIYISWIRNESEDANMLIPKKQLNDLENKLSLIFSQTFLKIQKEQ